MASTNKTTNYELSQYIGTDKPTYLGDYNSDMLKIDTAMAENKTSAENAVNVANNASTTAGNAQTTATTAQNTANQANTLAETAKTTADTALSNANQAQSDATKANNTLDQYTEGWVSGVCSGNTSGNFRYAYNETQKVFKMYGYGNTKDRGLPTFTLPPSMRPSSPYTIRPAGLLFGGDGGLGGAITLNVATSGVVSVVQNTQTFTYLESSNYYAVDFGDPSQTQ